MSDEAAGYAITKMALVVGGAAAVCYGCYTGVVWFAIAGIQAQVVGLNIGMLAKEDKK